MFCANGVTCVVSQSSHFKITVGWERLSPGVRPPPGPPARGHLSASSSVTAFSLGRAVESAATPALFPATRLLLATFFCGVSRSLPSPSSAAALTRLLAGGQKEARGCLTRPLARPPGDGSALGHRGLPWLCPKALSLEGCAHGISGAGEGLLPHTDLLASPLGHLLPPQGPSGGAQG